MTSSADREPSALPGTPAVICPYLRAISGEWRSAAPSREHLCGAEVPPTLLGLETQRRFCLAEPTSCERFRAAVEVRAAFAPRLSVRPIARTAPVVIDRGRSPLAIPVPVQVDRRAVGQGVLALVMIAAAAALIFARGSQPGGAPGQVAGASTGPTSSPTPTPTPTQTPVPSASPAATPTPRPSPSATAKPTPKARRTYRVQPGDTLGSIALRFGTTVKAISALNGIKDPSLIRPGQVLKIP